MALNAARHGALLYADESAFSEAVTTFDEGLPIMAPIDTTGLKHGNENPMPVLQYQNEGVLNYRTPFSGSFQVVLDLTGHGTAVASGASTATQLETFLGRVIGNMTAAQTGTTGVAAGSTVTVPVVADGSGVLDGGMLRIGALGDGDGEGQFFAVASEAANSVTLLTDMPGVIADSAVVHAPILVYPYEAPTNTQVTMRFSILTANAHYNCHGCAPTGIAFEGFGPGGRPRVTVTIGVSRWTTANNTFPQTGVTIDRIAPTVVTAASLFRQTFGTTTRNTETIRDFNFSVDLQVQLLPGSGSSNEFEIYTGAIRTKCTAKCDFVLDAETTGTYAHSDRFNTSELSAVFEHLLYSMAVGRDGASLGLYMRKAKMVDPRPVQFNMDGLNRQRLFYEAVTDTAGSNDITRSNFMLAFA